MGFVYNFVLICSLILCGISIYNYFTAFRLKRENKPENDNSLVSILIPARNEEKNIARALNSVINQTYKNTEIVVIDDKSEDTTSKIVEEIIAKHPNKRISLIHGTELPSGWMGKCWACHNLAGEANGDYFLFIDADVTLDKHAVASALYEIQEKELDMLTVFPKQIMRTLGEKVIVTTFMDWLLLTLLPLKLVYDMKYSSLSAVCGQFLMFERESYLRIGGHQAVAGEVVEDREFGYAIKNSGHKFAVMLPNDLVFCRMYNNFEESINGFTKNFYKGAKMPTWFFSLWIGIMFISQFMPFVLVFFSAKFAYVILIIILGRGVQAITIKQDPFETIVLHPLHMLSYLYMAIRSYAYAQRKVKEVLWKGRLVNS